MFAIHILLCQDVSGMPHNNAKLTKGKACQYLLRSQSHWPFRWHRGGLSNVKGERHSIHGDFGREIGNEGPIERATAEKQCISCMAVLALSINRGNRALLKIFWSAAVRRELFFETQS